MILHLYRFRSTAQGTPGELRGSDWELATLELPWLANERGRSCIPAGEYPCIWQESPRFGWCYEVTRVPQRTHILIHAGNWAGDRSKGHRSDVDGCILLGQDRGTLYHQTAVLLSKAALREFHRRMGGLDFSLEISWDELSGYTGHDL